MTNPRRIDQAPQIKKDSPETAPAVDYDASRVPTSTGDTPVYTDWVPRPIDKEPKNRNKLAAGIALGGVAASAILGAATYLGIRSAGNEQVEKMTGSDRTVSAPTTPGIEGLEQNNEITLDTATVDEFYNDAYFTDEERVDWAWSKLNEPSTKQGYEDMTILQAKYSELQAKYNSPNYKYIQDYVEPSESMAGDEILSLQTAIQTIAAESTELSDTERQKIIAAVADNSTADRERGVSRAQERDIESLNGIYAVRETPEGAKMESPVFRYHIPENGYNPNGLPSKVLNTFNVANDSNMRFQEIYRFINNIPVKVDSYSTSNANKRITYPENIPHEPTP